MVFYKCPDCSTYLTTQWGLLKGHFKLRHKDTRADLFTPDVKEEVFAPFLISEEEYNKITGKGGQGLIVETGLPKDETKLDTINGEPKKPPVDGTPKETPLTGTPEIITQYARDPVERLKQILSVNQVEAKIIQRITNIMSLSPRYWGDFRSLEELLVSHIGAPRRAFCQEIVMQYQDGLMLPQEGNRGMYPYSQGWNQPNLNNPYSYPPGYNPPMGGYGPPAPSPELADLKAEVARLRDEQKQREIEERRREEQQVFKDKIVELEKKIEGSGEVNQLKAQIEELKKALAGAGRTSMMVMYDEKGNPMQLPADPGLMEALRRKQEAETEALRTQQTIALLSANGGNTDKFDALLAQMKEDREANNKQIAELTKQLRDQQIDELKKEVKAAQDMAANSGTDGKGVADILTEAGENLKEGSIAVAKEVKESVDKITSTIKDTLTNRPNTPTPVVARSPQEIAGIMEEENAFLGALGEH